MRNPFDRAALIVVVMAGSVLAQRATPAEVAATLSGAWKLNRELSPSLIAPDRSGGRGGIPGGPPLFAMAMAAGQRGGRGGGGAGGGAGSLATELMPEEIAAQAALRIFQQIPLVVTIAATATEVTFTDPRGEWIYKIDDKTTTLEVPGSKIRVKTKWDRPTLRQEFSTTQRKLVKSWTVDANNRLVLTGRVESLTLNTIESRAVFDRQ